LPGSGKTTFGKKLASDIGAVRFSPDEALINRGQDGFDTSARIEVEHIQWVAACDALRGGKDVILENGFWERAERDRIRAEAINLGAQVKLHFLDVPISDLKRRLKTRNQDVPNGSFHVDPEMLDKWEAMFEPPTMDELEQ